jgi:hypothetical protein
VTDQSLNADGILFASHRDRALYIGQSKADRPRWLAENTGKWRRIRDVQQQAAPPQSLVRGEVTFGAGRYASPRRVASMLGVSVRTLSRWEATGIGPPKIKIGKKVLFDLAKLSDWLASREA